MKEVWQPVKDYEGLYEVSSLGRIRSLNHAVIDSCGKKQHFKGRLLKPCCTSGNYLIVTLHKGSQKKNFLVHRLVASAFVPNPHNYPQINHKDENKHNNKISNLEWCTAHYNNFYGSHMRRAIVTRRSNVNWKRSIVKNAEARKKTVIQCNMNGQTLKVWPSLSEVEKKLKINRSNISACCHGRRENAGGYVWKLVSKEDKDEPVSTE